MQCVHATRPKKNNSQWGWGSPWGWKDLWNRLVLVQCCAVSYQCWVVQTGVDLGVVECFLHGGASPSSGMLWRHWARTCSWRRRRAVLDQRHCLRHLVRRWRRHCHTLRAVRRQCTVQSTSASCHLRSDKPHFFSFSELTIPNHQLPSGWQGFWKGDGELTPITPIEGCRVPVSFSSLYVVSVTYCR